MPHSNTLQLTLGNIADVGTFFAAVSLKRARFPAGEKKRERKRERSEKKEGNAWERCFLSARFTIPSAFPQSSAYFLILPYYHSDKVT